MGTCGSKTDINPESYVKATPTPDTAPILPEFLSSAQYSSTYTLLSNDSIPITSKTKHLSETFQLFFRRHSDAITSISISPNNSYIATSSKDKTVRLWNVSKRRQIAEILHSKSINQVVISPNQLQLVTLSENQEIAVWSRRTCQIEKVFDSFPYHIGSIQMDRNDKEVYLAGGYLPQQNTCPIRVINIGNGEEVRRYEGHRAAANQMVFTKDFKFFVSCSGGQYMTVDDNSVRFWSVGNTEAIAMYSEFSKAVNAVVVSNELQLVLAGSRDCSIHMLSFKLTKINIFRSHTSSVTSLSLTKDELFLISGALDSTVKVWDLKNQWMTHEFKSSTVYSLAFLDPYIIAGCMCTIKLFDLNTHCEFGLPGHHGEIQTIQIKENSPFLLTCSVGKSGQDKSIQIWNLMTGDQEGVINQVPVFKKVELNSDGTGVLFTLENGSCKGYSLRGKKQWVNKSNRLNFYLMARHGFRVR